MFNNKIIFISGGTGSFGNKFVEIVSKKYKPKKIIIFSRDEFKQFEIGISTSLYFPAIGTAGFDRVAVKGDNLDPCPPPRIIDTTFFFLTFILYLLIVCKLLNILGIHAPMNDQCSCLTE